MNGIESYVVQAFRNAQNDLLSQSTGSRIHTWHVSDFVSPCLRKTWYSKTQPRQPMSDKTRSVLYNGLIVHEHSKLSHFHEVTFCYDIIQEKAYTPQQVQSLKYEDTRNIITGTLDDLINVNGNFVICDKKTFNGNGYIKTRPDPQYKRQLSIYRVLLESSYGIDARFGCLLYLDKTKDLQETPVSFELDGIEPTKQFLKDTLQKLQSLPEPNVCFLCNGMNKTKTIYCPYKEICQNE